MSTGGCFVKRLVLVFAVLELMFLGGCGIKGPLYMPPDGAKLQIASNEQNNENHLGHNSYANEATASIQSKAQP